MGIINMLGQGFLSLSILIILHEGGHFIAARFFGMRVEKFYLFFDFWNLRIFKKKIGDTEYGIGLIPLGGYVKIAGMVDESMDKEQLAQEPKPDEFRSKPAWQRLIVLLGGIVVNLLLGILIFSLSLWYYGKSYTPLDVVNAKTGIYATEWGKELGFQDGDKILKVNGKTVEAFGDLLNPKELLGDKLTYDISRNGAISTLTMPDDFLRNIGKKEKPFGLPTKFVVQKIQPGSNAKESGLQKGDMFLDVNGTDVRFYHLFKAALNKYKGEKINVVILRGTDTMPLVANVTENGTLGFQLENTSFIKDQKTKKYSLGSAFPAGNKMAFETLKVQIQSFGKMFSGKIKATESLGGPIAIFQNYGKQWNWQRFWFITGLLSLVLAFMNLLPIPVLDGGHAVFTIYEMVTGRPVNEKVLYVMQVIGMVLILALMVFVFGNDIYKLIK